MISTALTVLGWWSRWRQALEEDGMAQGGNGGSRTVIRTQSHKSAGFNELRFEDATDQEQIWLHAQKDLELLTLNDRTEEIKRDNHLKVHNDRISEIDNDEHHTVHRHRFEHTEGAQHLSVEGTMHMRAGEAWLSESGRELHIKAGQKAVLEADGEITLKAGGSFIKINASGITIVGPQVKINAGGSPGNGTGQAAKVPRLPGKATSEEHQRIPPIKRQPTAFAETEGQAIALKQAASSGKALCDICADTLKNSQGAAS